VKAAIGIATGILGLGAYLYLLGGLVVWLRLSGAQIPTDDAMRALDSRRLLAVGIKAFVFEAIMLGVLLLLATFAWFSVKRQDAKTPGTKSRDERRWEAWVFGLQGVIVCLLSGGVSALFLSVWWARAIGIALGLVWVFVVLPRLLKRIEGEITADVKTGRRVRWAIKTGLTIAAAAVAVVVLAAPAGIGVLVLLVFLHLSHRLKALPSVRKPTELIGAVLVLGAGLSIVVASYLATPPVELDDAVLVMVGGHTIEGGYVGQSSEGVFLATCVRNKVNPRMSRPSHLRIVSADRIRRVVIGGPKYVLDYGKDPSLLDLGRYFFGRLPRIGELFEPVALDVREDKLVCGLDQTFELERVVRHPRSHRVAELVRTFGAGTLVLSGDGLEESTATLKREGRALLPVALTPIARREHRCGAPLETEAHVVFQQDDGSHPTRSAVLKLPVAVPLPPGRRYDCHRHHRRKHRPQRRQEKRGQHRAEGERRSNGGSNAR
jgi:hypothetical protein